MTLLETIKKHYEKRSDVPPPWARDLGETVEMAVDGESLDETRWGTWKRWVYHDTATDEYVAVEDLEPATEYQDWEGDPSVFNVYPVTETVTVTKWVTEVPLKA